MTEEVLTTEQLAVVELEKQKLADARKAEIIQKDIAGEVFELNEHEKSKHKYRELEGPYKGLGGDFKEKPKYGANPDGFCALCGGSLVPTGAIDFHGLPVLTHEVGKCQGIGFNKR